MSEPEPGTISTTDWNRVHEQTLGIADASAAGNGLLRDYHRKKLIRLLDQLDDVYGRHPDLLSIRANVIDSFLEASALYEEAIRLGEGVGLRLTRFSYARRLLDQVDGGERAESIILDLQRDTPVEEVGDIRELAMLRDRFFQRFHRLPGHS